MSSFPLPLLLLLLLPSFVLGQSRSGSALPLEKLLEERIEEYLSDEREEENLYSGEELAEYLWQLAENPININRATRYDLQKLFILTPFQIESLLDYRNRSGDLLSLNELSLLNGFNGESAALLSPFITFGCSERGLDRGQKSFRSELYLRTFTRLKEYAFEKDKGGMPVSMLLKYGCEYGNRFKLNITAENDIGESLFTSLKRPVDFFSLSLSFENVALGGRRSKGFLNGCMLDGFVLGDFTARFGQGLVLWNSFSFGGSANPSALFKRGAQILPYTSAGESRFYRGAAMSLSLKRIDFALLFSHKRRDAKIEHGKYITLYDSGLHDTPEALASRKRLGETLFGASLLYNLTNFRVGVNYAAYLFDKRSGVKPNYYNKYRIYDGLWGNVSLSFSGNAGGFTLFGEVAADHGGSIALIAGLIRRIAGVESGFSFRYYPATYIAPHAGAYSSLSGCYNQIGGLFTARWQSFGGYTVEGVIDGCYYPKPRFNIKGSSSHFAATLKVSYNPREGVASWGVRLSDKWLSASNLYDFPTNKVALTLNADFALGSRFSLGIRSQHSLLLKKYSIATTLRGGCSLGRLNIKGGATLYDARLWGNRLYGYESDLPSSYGGTLFYGRGTAFYFLVKYEPLKKATLYTKLSSARGLQYIKFGLKVKID